MHTHEGAKRHLANMHSSSVHAHVAPHV